MNTMTEVLWFFSVGLAAGLALVALAIGIRARQWARWNNFRLELLEEIQLRGAGPRLAEDTTGDRDAV